MNSTLEVPLNTKEFLRATKNILALCTFSKESEVRDWVPSVMFSILPEGELVIAGASGHVVAIEAIAIDSVRQLRPVEVDVLLKNPQASDYIDDLTKAVSAVGKTSKARDAVITLSIEDGVKMSLRDGATLLAELPHYGTRRSFFEAMIDWVNSEPREMQVPVMLDAGILARFKAVRAHGAPPTRTPNIDLVGISDHPSGQAIMYRVGPTLTGVFRSIDREIFASGGPWGDAHGSPSALIKTKE